MEQIRAQILARAAIPTTNDPALTLLHGADGSITLQSRSAIPGFLCPDPRDRRRLGVKVASITLGDEAISPDHPALIEGWHDPDSDGRWTNGNAVIPAALVLGRKATLKLAATLAYPLNATRRSSARTTANSQQLILELK
ncbi:MAG: hypothetical protein B7Z57_12440 [Acidiphilium sp. 37-60-79]|nr:MAG: hypothetical protein B7Z57_12440 [Acidiphilium sp. 37-60-79]